MKAKLQAGAEIDLLTQAELEQVLESFFSGYLRPAQTVRVGTGIRLDSSGQSVIGTVAHSVPVFECPMGYRFRLHRLGVFADGYTFAVPFTNAAGYLEIRRNGQTQDGISLASPGLPQVWTAGDADAIEYRNDEAVQIWVTGGPPSTSVNLRIEGTLQPYTAE